MKESSGRQFGIMVAYVLPGFIGLAGLTPLFPMVAEWLRPVDVDGLGLGPPLYTLMGATTIGLVLSAIRWLLLDHVHAWMGVRRPKWDDSRLDEKLGGVEFLVQTHFRYYEFAGNTLLALLATYALNRIMGNLPFLGIGTDAGVVLLAFVLFVASRDALMKYYTRTARLVGDVTETELGGFKMFNGSDHGAGHGTPAQPKQDPKPKQQPSAPAVQPASTPAKDSGKKK